MTRTFSGIAAAAVALSLGLAAPANAEDVRAKDPADIHHGVDLRNVRVDHGRKLLVVLRHTNLRPAPKAGASGSVFIDTDPSDPGPELVFTGGFFRGTDYQLLHTDGFAVKKWGEPVDAGHGMRLVYRKNRTRIRISRAALGDVDRVRVAVKVAGNRTNGSTVTDWLGGRRSWTRWVARG